MPAVLFLVETFGVPILAGWLGASLIWVVLGALAVSAMNVATGWRAGAAGPVPSVLVGACFSLIVAVPVFYLAGWLASGSSGG